jgi:hypothetical protein
LKMEGCCCYSSDAGDAGVDALGRPRALSVCDALGLAVTMGGGRLAGRPPARRTCRGSTLSQIAVEASAQATRWRSGRRRLTSIGRPPPRRKIQSKVWNGPWFHPPRHGFRFTRNLQICWPSREINVEPVSRSVLVSLRRRPEVAGAGCPMQDGQLRAG